MPIAVAQSAVRTLLRRHSAVFGSAPTGHRLTRVTASPQFRDGSLRNLVPTSVTRPGSSARVLYTQLTGWGRRKPPAPVPVHRPDPRYWAEPPASGLRLTWLGHATVLGELGTRRVLFDPVWSRRCSPYSFAGPTRQHETPIALEDLPDIDIVAISHDHYDHLDVSVVRFLAETSRAQFAVPLGVGAHLEHWGVPAARITELDWHESASLKGLSVTATPARHYSGRSLRPSRAVLWSSWVVADGTSRIFHAGDTGYFAGLREIGEAYGPFDATLMPVGAYHELWPDVHMTPEEAVQAHHDVRGRTMLPIHWGTYNLAPHPWSEPIERAVTASTAETLLLTPLPGQPMEPADAVHAHAVTPWWTLGTTESRTPAGERALAKVR